MAPLEKYIIEQGAPTLASLKTGTLFCVDTTEPGELLRQIGLWNSRLRDKGVSITLLRCVETLRLRAPRSCWRNAATPRLNRGMPLSDFASAFVSLRSSRTRSACFWVIRSAMCWDTSRTGGKTASSPAGGRYTATRLRPHVCSHAFGSAGMYTRGSGARADRCSSSLSAPDKYIEKR